MFRLFTVVMMLAIVIVACTATNTAERRSVGDLKESPVAATFASAKTLAQQESRDILIKFYTDW